MRKDEMVWRCNKIKCISRLYTSYEYNIVSLTEHNHQSNDIKNAYVIFMDALKKECLLNNESERNLICRMLEKYSVQEEIHYNYEAVRDMIKRYRKKKFYF
ncbi:hypothetical protein DMUE_5131 [Dictyocoela muelleri]|nr:hypothetical protein DMUE_5131 [Dictyocoela muelleri]